MITKENYSRAEMAKLLQLLTKEEKEAIATELELPKTTVDNVFYGKSFNEEVVRLTEKKYKKAFKAYLKTINAKTHA